MLSPTTSLSLLCQLALYTGLVYDLVAWMGTYCHVHSITLITMEGNVCNPNLHILSHDAPEKSIGI